MTDRAGHARVALAAAFAGLVHNQDDGTDSADRALRVLRSLPVEQRMEAMGMRRVTDVYVGDVWAEPDA